MIQSIRGYRVLSSLVYRLAIFVGMPLFVLLMQWIVTFVIGVDMSFVLLTTVMPMEVIADTWFLGGIQSQNAENMDFLKTSAKGRSVLKGTLIVDLIRRFVYLLLLAILFAVIKMAAFGQESVLGDIVYIRTMFLSVMMTFVLTLIGVFINRFNTYFWLSIIVSYVLYNIASAVMIVIMLTGACSWIPGIICTLISLALCVLLVWFALKRMEDGYYDK